jgi:beta-lactamase class A
VSNATSTALLAEVQHALREELHRFVAGDSFRSVAVETLDEPSLRLDIGGDVPRPAASFVKVLLAIALYDAAARGEVDLDQRVHRRELGRTKYPTILAAFDHERQLTLRELCAFSLMTSDNPAAEYLRRLVGAERVAAVSDALGLHNTIFGAGFSDDDLASNATNVTTAREALRTLIHIEQTPALDDLRRFLINNLRNFRIPARLGDDIPVLHKTGSLETVVLDAGIIYAPHGRIALAYFCDRQPDTVMTSVEIADSALRVLEILAKVQR